jgi:hypothetical protein
MDLGDLDKLYDSRTLAEILPLERSDRFFEALLGDAEEGAYTIVLAFRGKAVNQLQFDLELHRRPEKCLACNLTYGLPEVFQRHPIVDLKGLVGKLENRLAGKAQFETWSLGATEEISMDLHRIPLTIQISAGPEN